MYTRIVTFRLAGITADEYEQHCDEIADAFSAWDGLKGKVWLADRETGTFGGFYLFDSKAAADASRDTWVFAAMSANPHFVDLRVDEYDTLAGPTAVTARPFVDAA